MSDERVQKAWRDWVADPIAELAQVYCVEITRAGKQPSGATPLKDIYLDTKYRSGLSDLIESACAKYLRQDFSITMLEDLHWLTENHYWIAGEPSPSLLRAVAKLYADHGMELLEGDEEAAQADLEVVRRQPRTSPTEEADKETKRLKADLSQAQANLKALGTRLDEQSTKHAKELKDKEAWITTKDSEIKRLRAELSRLQRFETDAHKLAGLEATNHTLMRENERLTRIIQGREEATSG